MHEMPVTQSILKTALQHAEKVNAKRITGLHIVMGELSSMVGGVGAKIIAGEELFVEAIDFED